MISMVKAGDFGEAALLLHFSVCGKSKTKPKANMASVKPTDLFRFTGTFLRHQAGNNLSH